MAKNQEGFFRSMGDIDVMEEVVAVGANVVGGVTGAWVMNGGLDKLTTKSTKDDNGQTVPEYDKPIIPKSYRPWVVLTLGVLGRTFITNPQIASFFGGMATIGGAKGIVETMFKDSKADYGFAGLGAANTDYRNQPNQVIETEAGSFEEFDTITDAARTAAMQTQVSVETGGDTPNMNGVGAATAEETEVMVN